jgi:hypothetical protein
VMKIHSEGHS